VDRTLAVVACAFALGGVVTASGCDHVHWLGILDAGGGGATDAYPDSIPDGGWSEAGTEVFVPPEVGGDGGAGAAGCPAACAAIMGCGLGGYGPYQPGAGYAYAYVIGPYAYASGVNPYGSPEYGAYGFRDLEYQQCVVTCQGYSDCVGCGPDSERDRIVSCVLANTCPALLDCMAR
jgi:hypothetical protein